MKSRILVVFAGIILVWLTLIVRAGSLQIFPNAKLKALRERQFQTVITLQSRRGAIIDRKGRELALSTVAYSVYADPKLLTDKKHLAQKLAKQLGESADSIYGKIRDQKKRFIWLARLLPKEKIEKLKQWNIHGISIVEEYKRVYPNNELLAQTLGMVGGDGQGLEGLELGYDQYLRGSRKKVVMRRDARGRPLIADGMIFAENPDGSEIRLTIDSEMQYMLENELKEAVHEFEADQAFGIILDAKTSAILAMANTPMFDANFAANIKPEYRRNRIITDAFEPGSTMKAFTIATAMRNKVVAPNTKYNTENGKMRIGNRVIHDAESDAKWSHLSVSEILAYSSNIGATKIAFDLGEEALRNGLLDFGFGSKLGLDLPGEGKGILQPAPWSPISLSNISFGHGIAVTPLQIANAYAAIANGGVLNTPYVVQSIEDPESGEVIESKTKSIRRVLSVQDAASMRLMLMGVTAPGGTGVNAKVDGFQVAGKTGTAQKANPNGRGYLGRAYISSFAGFIPANDPKFVIYIAVDYPHKNSHYGAVVAAPVFSRVASYAVRMAGLAPVLLTEKNLLPSTHFSNNPSQESLPKKNVATVAPLPLVEEKPSNIVPNLKNLTMREVLRRLSNQDVVVKFVGSGVVSETEPSTGKDLTSKKQITVYLKQ